MIYRPTSRIALNWLSKDRLFSKSVLPYSLFYSSTADLTLLPQSIPSNSVSIKLIDAIPATETDLKKFIRGITPPDSNPVAFFFKTQEVPFKLDGLDNVYGWGEKQVIVDILAYSTNYGLDVFVPEQNHENNSQKKP